MTANQVNYASVEVSRDAQAETERHNQATEVIQREANGIQAAKVENDRLYQAQSLAIQREYNQAYLSWTKSSGTKKLELEQQMNDINQQKVDLEKEYKSNDVFIRTEANKINQSMIGETNRHNLTLERISQQQNLIKDKEVEYANYVNLENIDLKKRDLDNVEKRIANESSELAKSWYELDIKQEQLDAQLRQLDLEERALDIKQQEANAKTFTAHSNFFVNIFKGITTPWRQ